VYALKWSEAMFPNEIFYCVDLNGMYSWCACAFRYPIGKYNVLIGKDISNVTIKDNLLYIQDKHLMGSIMLTILPPSDLEQPFLMYRKKNGTTILALCKECAENENVLCKHDDKTRSFTATYMISEVEFALTLGYEIINIHEIHYFLESDFILKDFVKKLNVFKLQSTDCFQNCQTDLEKENLCTLVNDRMELNHPDCITSQNVKPNQAKKNFYKLMCNSLFGKFIQRNDKSQIKYINHQDELNDLYYKGIKIEDFFCVNENVCMINTSKNVLKLPPNRSQNIYVGNQVTAYARQVIYQHMLKLKEIPQCQLYQIECDSLFFSLPKNVKCDLNFSPALGDFKQVYDGSITGFYSLGQKQYCVNYVNNDSLQSIFKVSGLCLKNKFNSEQVNENTFETFLDKFIEGSNCSKVFLQSKKQSDFVNLKVISYQQKYTLTNKLSSKRFVNVFDDRLKSYPFGFKFDC